MGEGNGGKIGISGRHFFTIPPNLGHNFPEPNSEIWVWRLVFRVFLCLRALVLLARRAGSFFVGFFSFSPFVSLVLLCCSCLVLLVVSLLLCVLCVLAGRLAPLLVPFLAPRASCSLCSFCSFCFAVVFAVGCLVFARPFCFLAGRLVFFFWSSCSSCFARRASSVVLAGRLAPLARCSACRSCFSRSSCSFSCLLVFVLLLFCSFCRLCVLAVSSCSSSCSFSCSSCSSCCLCRGLVEKAKGLKKGGINHNASMKDTNKEYSGDFFRVRDIFFSFEFFRL